VRLFSIITAVVLLAGVLPAPAAAADSNVFLKATVGGSYPFMQNLNSELKAQGR